MTDDEAADLARRLRRNDLPASFERWRVALPAGAREPAAGRQWAGALVMVEQGALEVECGVGACLTFCAGDLLVLDRLPRAWLRAGAEGVRLLAVRRRREAGSQARSRHRTVGSTIRDAP